MFHGHLLSWLKFTSHFVMASQTLILFLPKHHAFLPHLSSLNHSTFRSDDEAMFFMRTSATSSCAKLCCCFVQEKEGEMVMDRSGKLDFSLRLVFGDDDP